MNNAGVALAAVGAPAGMPSAVIQFAQLRQRHLADQSGPVRRPVHPPVVHADQVAVAGQPHIAFDTVGALLQRQLIGGQGVLGTFGRMRPGAPPRTGGRRARRRPSSYGLCCRVLAFGLNRSGRFGLRFRCLARFRRCSRLSVVGTITQRLDGRSTGWRSKPRKTFITSSNAASASR